MDYYVLDMVKRIKFEMKDLFGSNPPDKLLYDKLYDIIKCIQEDTRRGII